MNVLMSEDLLELYEKGSSRRYKDVSRNPELMHGFLRAVKVMSDAVHVQQICPSASVSGAS